MWDRSEGSANEAKSPKKENSNYSLFSFGDFILDFFFFKCRAISGSNYLVYKKYKGCRNMLNNTNQPILEVYFKIPQPNEFPGSEKEKRLLNLKE